MNVPSIQSFLALSIQFMFMHIVKEHKIRLFLVQYITSTFNLGEKNIYDSSHSLVHLCLKQYSAIAQHVTYPETSATQCNFNKSNSLFKDCHKIFFFSLHFPVFTTT